MGYKTLKCNHVSLDGKVKCNQHAVWEIWFGNDISDFVLTCREHVGELLTEEDEHRLFRVLD